MRSASDAKTCSAYCLSTTRTSRWPTTTASTPYTTLRWGAIQGGCRFLFCCLDVDDKMAFIESFVTICFPRRIIIKTLSRSVACLVRHLVASASGLQSLHTSLYLFVELFETIWNCLEPLGTVHCWYPLILWMAHVWSIFEEEERILILNHNDNGFIGLTPVKISFTRPDHQVLAVCVHLVYTLTVAGGSTL